MAWGVANSESGDYCGGAKARAMCTTASGKPAWSVLSAKQLTVLHFASDREAPAIGTPTGRWCLCLRDTKIFVLKTVESSPAAFILRI